MVWIVIASQLFGSLVLKDIQDLGSKMKEVLALKEKKKTLLVSLKTEEKTWLHHCNE